MKALSPATRKVFAPLAIDKFDHCNLRYDKETQSFVADFWHKKPDSNYKFVPKQHAQEFIKRFPESKKLANSGSTVYPWQLAATDYTVELFASLWPREQLEFHDADTKALYDVILTRSLFAEQCAEVSATFKLRRERFNEAKDSETKHYLLPNCLIVKPEGEDSHDKEYQRIIDNELAIAAVPVNDYEFSAEYPLNPYQQIAEYNLMQSEGYGLFMEQGTGKTAPTIAAICNQAKLLQRRLVENNSQPRMYRGIIVCPKNVRMNWEKEFQKFATQPGKITVLRGNEVGRIKQIIDATANDGTSIYTLIVCSYETLTRSWDALQFVPWDIAVLDEGHYIKSVKTKRFETALKLRDSSQQRVVLTGTPITNTHMDLYALFEFMGKGYSGFNSFDAFRKFYGVYETTESGHQALVGMQNLPFMQERLARYSYIISKIEALPDLPAKVYDVHEIEMSEQQAEFYKELCDKLAIEIEAELSGDSTNRSMVINNVLTKLLRLAHITSGFVTWGEQFDDFGDLIQAKRIEHFRPNPKIDAVLELLAEKSPDQKTIIWACWSPDIVSLTEAMESKGIDYVKFVGGTSDAARKEAEDRFNGDVNCKVFIGNAAAGGTGLNLLGYTPGEGDKYTTNCDHVIYYSQNWSPTQRSQSEDRAHRNGTRVQVRYTDLVVPRTIDEEIRSRVVEKRMNAMDITELRETLRNVFNQGE